MSFTPEQIQWLQSQPPEVQQQYGYMPQMPAAMPGGMPGAPTGGGVPQTYQAPAPATQQAHNPANQMQLPAHLQNRTSDVALTSSAAFEGLSMRHPEFRVTNGHFQLVKGGNAVATYNGEAFFVILGASPHSFSRVFYEGEYAAGGDNKPPSCWSTDGKEPDAAAPSPQCNACQGCPMNVKGSAPGGRKKCAHIRRMVVSPIPDQQNPVSAFVFQMNAGTVIGDSIAHEMKHSFRDLMQYLQGQGEAVTNQLHNIIIGASIDPNGDGGHKVVFRVTGQWLSPEQSSAVENYMIENRNTIESMVVLDFPTGAAGAAPTPPNGGAAPAQAQQAAPGFAPQAQQAAPPTPPAAQFTPEQVAWLQTQPPQVQQQYGYQAAPPQMPAGMPGGMPGNAAPGAGFPQGQQMPGGMAATGAMTGAYPTNGMPGGVPGMVGGAPQGGDINAALQAMQSGQSMV